MLNHKQAHHPEKQNFIPKSRISSWFSVVSSWFSVVSSWFSVVSSWFSVVSSWFSVVSSWFSVVSSWFSWSHPGFLWSHPGFRWSHPDSGAHPTSQRKSKHIILHLNFSSWKSIEQPHVIPKSRKHLGRRKQRCPALVD